MVVSRSQLEQRASEVERLAEQIAGEVEHAGVRDHIASLREAVEQLMSDVRSEFEDVFEDELGDLEVALVAEAREAEGRGETSDARTALTQLGAKFPDS